MLKTDRIKQDLRGARVVSEEYRVLIERDREKQRSAETCQACRGCGACSRQ